MVQNNPMSFVSLPRSFALICAVAWLLPSMISAQQYAELPFEDDFFEPEFAAAWVARPDTDNFGTVTIVNEYARLGKSRDGSDFATNTLDLHLDLEGEEDVYFSFSMFNFNDEAHEQDGLYFSDDGGQTFVRVYQFVGDKYCAVWGEFPPFYVDRLAADAGLDLTATFVIRIQQFDNADFAAGYQNERDGLGVDNVHVYAKERVFATLPFSDNFDDGTATLGDSWRWSAADNSVGSLEATNKPTGFVAVQDNYGTNNTYGVRMTKRCDDGYSANALDLLLDLGGQSDVYLEFNYYDLSGEDEVQDGLYFSNDGGVTFTQVYTFLPESYCTTWGKFPPLSVDELAAAAGITFTDKFVIRFQEFDDADSNSGYRNDADGLYLDNVEVYSRPPSYAPLPFTDDFDDGSGELSEYWRWSTADSTVAPIANATKPTGYVAVENTYGTENSYGVRMTKRCDDDYSVNALDLFLDLAGQEDVYLSYSIYDRGDDNDPQDGIYLSDDGGKTFHQVQTWVPESWCNGIYGAFAPLNLDRAAESVGLSLTGTFVVRFQQYSDSDYTSGYQNDADGILLDDVSVVSRPPVYASLPLEDDFDDGTGRLGSHWRWSMADSSTLALTNVNKPTASVGVVNEAGQEGSFGLRLTKRCDDGYSASAADLLLNLAGESDVFLSFDMRDIGDEDDAQDGIYLSNDGGRTFHQVQTFQLQTTCDNVWSSYPPFDLDRLAASVGLEYTSQFVVRFQQYDNADNRSGYQNDYDGFALDNVKVYSRPAVYADLPFLETFDDGTGEMPPSFQPVHADSTIAPLEDVVKLSGYTAIGATRGMGGSGGLMMGKSCDDGFNVTAVDLHLNLDGASGVSLGFHLYDAAEEQQAAQEGIYYSADGGQSFVNLYQFRFDDQTNYEWMKYELNLDSLLNEAGVAFSARSVVRFQQYDDADFNINTRGDIDGIILDSIYVYADSIISNVDQPSMSGPPVAIFPNPSTGSVTVRSPWSSDNPIHIEVLDIRGRRVLYSAETTRLSEGETLDLRHLHLDGLYVLRLRGDRITTARKVLFRTLP